MLGYKAQSSTVCFSENDVMRVWFLRVFVICGFLCFFLKMLVVLKNVSSKNVDL